jgi:hypothetical protein
MHYYYILKYRQRYRLHLLLAAKLYAVWAASAASASASAFGEVLARRLPSFVSNTFNARVRVETVTLNASKTGPLLSRGDILASTPPFTILRYRRQVVVS